MNGNSSPAARKESSKSSYKLWVLLAVMLMAFWSMFTGSVTLKRSVVGSLYGLSDDFKTPNFDDLDILEVEEREKVVRHMWDLYGQSKSAKLPRFWQEAFEAAYENLVSDVPGLRDLAFSEIAKLSIFFVAVDSIPIKSRGKERRDQPRKMAKQIVAKKEEAIITTKPSKKEKEKKKDLKVKPLSNLDDQVESDN